MAIVLKNDIRVIKSFNNNILLVKENGEEKILFSKGIGFAKKLGDIIEKGTTVEKVFVISNEDNKRNFNEILNKVDDELIGLVEEALAEISDELRETLNENIHIGLVDHLYYSFKRLKNNENIENSFIIEIETLYKKEFELASRLAKRIEGCYQIEIPISEIGFITLHIQSARNDGQLSNTIKYSFLSNSIIEHLEDRLKIEIDRKSLDYARFLTHIRFAIERILTNNEIKNDLRDIIKIKYSDSYKIGEEVRNILEKGLDIKVSDDEIAYLVIHIERFKR